MTDTAEQDILEKLDGLARQASSERSHYYVAAVVGEAHREIVKLRGEVALLWRANREGHHVSRTR